MLSLFVVSYVGMPMMKDTDFGRNKDETKNSVQIAMKMGWPEEEACEMAEGTIPKLSSCSVSLACRRFPRTQQEHRFRT